MITPRPAEQRSVQRRWRGDAGLHRRRRAARHGRVRPARRGLLLAAGMAGALAGAGTGWAIQTPAPSTLLAGSAHAVERPVDAPTAEPPAPQPSPSDRTPPSAVPGPLDEAADRVDLPQAPTFPPPVTAPEPLDPMAPDAAGLTAADRQAGLLSPAVPTSASGQLVVVPGTSPAPHVGRTVRTVRVEVEQGLEMDPAVFAGMVMTTLNDPRSWGGDGSVSFARTDGEADLRVVLASPTLVDALCAPLETVGVYSCGRDGRAVLNHTRWVQATAEFADLTVYRQYLVNHEVGHLLGHGHVPCPSAGAVAPVMQQQTVAVAPCVVNGWPFPDAG